MEPQDPNQQQQPLPQPVQQQPAVQPQHVNPTAQAYHELKGKDGGKKMLTIVIMICAGLIVIAGIAVAAYYATGDRTEQKIENLESELNVPEENPEQPSAE